MISSPDVIWAVVPIKSFALAKARLSPVLCPDDRQRLALAMADDVLGAIRAAGMVDRLCLLSDQDSRAASELAARHGAYALKDQEIGDAPGLNAAIQGTAALASANGAGALLIVHSDLPLLTADALLDLMQMWQALRGPQRVVLARSRDGGTNLLLAERPASFAYRFGVGSYALHRDECARRGCTVAAADSASTSLDIDTPDDLECLRLAVKAGLCGSHTAALIGELTPLNCCT